jgi:excisionase family DNA binding protein
VPLEVSGSIFYTNGEAADRAGVTRQTLWRWRSDGRIPLGRQYRGKSVLFTEDELTEIVQYAHRIEPLDVDPSIQPSLFNNRNRGIPG